MFFLSSFYVPRIPLVRIPRGTKLLEERKNWPDAPITKRPRAILPRKLFIIPRWLVSKIFTRSSADTRGRNTIRKPKFIVGNKTLGILNRIGSSEHGSELWEYEVGYPNPVILKHYIESYFNLNSPRINYLNFYMEKSRLFPETLRARYILKIFRRAIRTN